MVIEDWPRLDGFTTPVRRFLVAHTLQPMKILYRVAALAAFVLSLAAPAPVLAAPGDLDAFDTLMQHNVATGSMGPSATVMQPDGKILAGGFFYFDTIPTRKWLVRLQPDGSPDTGFNHQLDLTAETIAVQPDGKIVITGGFGTIGGITRNHIARLNADGTLDTGFDPNPNNYVYGAAVQPDGKVLLWGKFTALQPNGAATATSRSSLARVNADGTLDPDFSPLVPVTPVFNQYLNTVAVQADGKILVGGVFAAARSTGAATPIARSCLVRFDAAGVVDESFDPNTGEVTNILVRGDGKILIGGYFDYLQPNGGAVVARKNMALLNPDGTVDPSFVPDPSVPYAGASLGLQADGKVIVGEIYTQALGFQVVRLNADGSLGAGFLPRPQAGRYVNGVDLQADGKVLLSGTFDTLQPNNAPAPITRAKLARLLNDPATQTLTVSDTAHVQWQRGGSAPEVSRTTFELSTNGGTSWTPLGAGTWATANGRWEMSGLALPRSGMIRARGVTNGGFHNNSYGLIEQVQAFDFPPTPGDVDTLDAHFQHSINNFNGVNATAVQPDGKILVGGTYVSGLGPTRKYLVRLNEDGTLDEAFDPQVTGYVWGIAVQADGKIVIVGDIFTIAGSTRNFVARLNPDGTLDTDFDPNANSPVIGVAIQADGKVLVWGNFTALSPNGVATVSTHRSIARLNPNGTVDEDFDPAPSFGSYVLTLEEQSDGRLLVGGNFLSIRPHGSASPVSRHYLARLNVDGTLDMDFDPQPSGVVENIAARADGKIVVSGQFGTFQPNGTPTAPRPYVARLNSDGTVDAGFALPWSIGLSIRSLTLQANGKVLIGGAFTGANGGPSFVVRLNSDGTPDAAFDPKPSHEVNSVEIQGDGKVLLGGRFDTVQPNGAPAPITRTMIARLENDPAVQVLTAPDATQAIWQRSGAAPELSHAYFELSTDGGGSWAPLGPAARVIGTSNWQLTGLALPLNGRLRARGATGGGYGHSSHGLIEQAIEFTFVAPSPLEQWKLSHLGDANAADLGDPDYDGLVTLAEYGLDLSPGMPSTAPVAGVFQYVDGQRLGIILRRNPAHNDVTVEVQAADFPEGPWTTVATSVNGAPFTGPGFVHEEVENSGVLTVEISDTVTVSEAPQRFLRVEVTR